MTTRDTRASEMAAAKWEPQGKITDATRRDGWVTIATDSGIGFGIQPEFAATRIDVGEEVAICGGLGAPIQGVRVGGRLVFFKTKANLAADRRRWLDDFAAKRRAEYDASHERWRAEVDGLPPLLRARMERFIGEAGGFEPFFLDAGRLRAFLLHRGREVRRVLLPPARREVEGRRRGRGPSIPRPLARTAENARPLRRRAQRQHVRRGRDPRRACRAGAGGLVATGTGGERAPRDEGTRETAPLGDGETRDPEAKT